MNTNDNFSHAAHQQAADPSLLTEEQLRAEVVRLRAENEALKVQTPPPAMFIVDTPISPELQEIWRKALSNTSTSGRITIFNPSAFSDELFKRVMTASAAYVARFGGQPTEEGTIRKLDEEVFEFKFAITDSTPEFIASQEGKSAIAGELIDLLVTSGGVAAWAGLTWDDIKQAAHDTLAKLDARTEKTHAWNPDTKTVERRGR